MKTRIVTAVIGCFLFMTSAHGQSLWKEVALPHVAGQLTTIDFADSLAGWIFADSGTYLKTRDGGKSWTVDSIGLPLKIVRIRAFSDTVCWAIARDNQYTPSVYITRDGHAWQPVPIPDTLARAVRFGGIGFSSSSTIWLPSIKGVFVSSDYGQSWRFVRSAWGYEGLIEFRDSSHGYLAFNWSGAGGENNGRSFTTKDGGATWDSIPHDEFFSYYAIKFYDPSYGYFVSGYIGMDGLPHYFYLSATYDGGTHQHDFSDYPYIFSTIGCLYYKSGGTLLVSSYHRMKALPADTTRFSLVVGSEGTSLVAFESVPEKFNWILGAGNRLFQSIGIPTAVEGGNEERSGLPVTFSLKNYPNPFNPSTTLAFTIPSNSFVTLKVFDLLGREVTTIVAEELSAGTHVRTWNAARMPSGVYVCRLEAGGYHAASKLVLMK